MTKNMRRRSAPQQLQKSTGLMSVGGWLWKQLLHTQKVCEMVGKIKPLIVLSKNVSGSFRVKMYNFRPVAPFEPLGMSRFDNLEHEFLANYFQLLDVQFQRPILYTLAWKH